MIPRIEMAAAEQLFHAFRVIPGMRYRVVVYAEQQVGDRWIEMSSTQLSTFSRSNRETRNQDPTMPTRPPPAPPAAEDQVVPQQPPPAAAPAAAAEEQVVPSDPPQQSTSHAAGPIRSQRRTRVVRVAAQRRSSSPTRTSRPARPSQPPTANVPPLTHQMLVPAWAVLANDIWFACPICTERVSHSGVVCGQFGGRPACCECLFALETSRSTQGRCPFCRYEGRPNSPF
jgi:hypothetical protein